MADYATYGYTWNTPTISWYYSGDPKYRAEFIRALDRWDALIDIDFVEASSAAAADVNISFISIDGPYNVLAQAGGSAYSTDLVNYYYSGDSVVEFDSAEVWTWNDATQNLELTSGTSFYEVALHEIGHVLGLSHSTNSGALMYPNAGGAASDISIWDEAGIHSLYAPEAAGKLVSSAVTATLNAVAESLTLTGAAAIDGTGNAKNNVIAGNSANNILRGEGGNDSLRGGDGYDTLIGGSGNDNLVGGAQVDTAVFSGNRAAYAISRSSDGLVVMITGPDGTDTLSGIERLEFADGTFALPRGIGQAINPLTANPNSFMNQIRDFDGNNLGSNNNWQRIGSADIEGNGDTEVLFVNSQLGRWASVGIASDGLIYMQDHSWGGDTRVVGTYIDPLIESGDVVAGGPHDSQVRFANDLEINNIGTILGADDYDNDGYQEIYFKIADGTAYLHAYMHADGNIRYANYQVESQVIDYLTSNGFGPSAYDGWFT